MNNPAIRKALTIEEIFKADAQERRLYEMREKAFLDEISNVEGAKAEGKTEGKAEGITEGEANMAKNVICRSLEAHFGAESQALQETVRTITNLDTLNRIIDRIFGVKHLDDAKALIQASLVSQ